jgi:predicted short-subunit dehydrogenase-like oxidoreductase (DUF2520 family)
LQIGSPDVIFTVVQSISIIGAGRVGGALAIALNRTGYTIDSVYYRGTKYLAALKDTRPQTTRFENSLRSDLPASDILFIASGDPDIRGIADEIAELSGLPKFAFHTSGSLSSEELSSLSEKGVRTGSLHPLAAVSDPVAGAERFRGAFFCVEGDEDSVKVAEELALAVGGRPFSIPSGSKPIYHAAAVMSAGHVVALLDAAIEMMTHCGLSPDESREILVPLAAGSIENLKDRRPAAALTGPYARGDASALSRHVSSFEDAQVGDELRNIYLDLALRSVEMMAAEGRELEPLRESILIAKQRGE